VDPRAVDLAREVDPAAGRARGGEQGKE